MEVSKDKTYIPCVVWHVQGPDLLFPPASRPHPVSLGFLLSPLSSVCRAGPSLPSKVILGTRQVSPTGPASHTKAAPPCVNSIHLDQIL